MLEEAKRIRVRKAEGQYMNDNPDLEHKSKWGKKLDSLEEKYKDVPKIAFHTLDDEGNLQLMQCKRDRILRTVGWSLIGNIGGVGVVRYIEKNSDRYRTLKHFKKREALKIFGFLGTVGLFTLYGYASAQ